MEVRLGMFDINNADEIKHLKDLHIDRNNNNLKNFYLSEINKLTNDTAVNKHYFNQYYFLKTDNEFIGYFLLENLIKPSGEKIFEISYYICNKHRKKGYASSGLNILLNHLFLSHNLKEIFAKVSTTNIGSLSVIKSNGFEYYDYVYFIKKNPFLEKKYLLNKVKPIYNKINKIVNQPKTNFEKEKIITYQKIPLKKFKQKITLENNMSLKTTDVIKSRN